MQNQFNSLITVSAQDTTLLDIVARASRSANIPARALHLQALMHLPRIAGPDGMLPDAQAAAEVSRVASFVPSWPEWDSPTVPTNRAAEWQVRELEEQCARQIFERFHYIGSHRRHSQHYGMWPAGHWGRPTVAASVSENDVAFLRGLAAQTSIRPERSRVLSRVFAFPNSPPNAVSTLLSRIARQQKLLAVELLLTYVNPNLGFTGVSYRASNWTLVGSEAIQVYYYVDERYITNRELDTKFGSHDPERLSRLLGLRFASSVMLLSPLLVFARRL